VAAATEEFFKFLVFMLVIWNNRNFNEKFDGIVYAVFISLGFAGIENVLYVFSYGVEIGYVRAFTAVPLHALVAVVMGYHLGLAKMGTNRRNGHLFLALVLPILFHGFYDWILMIRQSWYLLLYVPFLYFLWRRAFRRIKTLSEESRFNPKNTWKLPDDFFKKN
jgi:RsiW-degrading membrane proteinase PrsW (M82 family)